MIVDVQIENFRGIHRLEVNGAARINVIVGGNGIGKTSVLEALCFANSPTPVIAQQLDNFRDFWPDYKARSTSGAFRYLFGRLDAPLRVCTRRDSGVETVEMVLADVNDAWPEELEPDVSPAGKSQGVLLTTERHELQWSLTTPNRSFKSHVRVRADGLAVARSIENLPNANGKLRMCSFSTGTPALMPNEIGHFSSLRATNHLEPLLACLRQMFPQVVDLELLAPNGQQAAPHVRFANKEMLPLAVLGLGAQKVVALMTRLTMTPGGVALVDEIESGLHYSVLVPVLRQFASLAATLDVQVFATTHSYECLQAVHAALGDKPGELAVFRLESVPDGRLLAVRIDARHRDAVFQVGAEVR